MKLVPVVFARMCCMQGAVAGQDKLGAVWYREVKWLGDQPWLYMPPPMAPAPGHGVKTAKVKPARRRSRRARS